MKKGIVFAIAMLFFAVSFVSARPKEGNNLIRLLIKKSVQSANMNGEKVSDNEAVLKSNGKKLFFMGGYYLGELHFYKNGDGTLSVVNVLPIEDYLVGLVTGEMPANWPLEALKAQAVVARTYALFQKEARKGTKTNYDLEASVIDQVYKGVKDEDERIKNAVLATKGEALVKNGKVLKAFFHSTCGGVTETALSVWGEEIKFPMVSDAFCARSPHSLWSYKISKERLASLLRGAGFPATTIESVQLEFRKDNPRVATLTIDTGGQTIFIQGSDFRRIVGFDNLKSTWFDAGIVGNRVEFAGRGYGHGVGMCQWGAKGMAEAGRVYKEILAFYYPGTGITKYDVGSRK